jgi:hypothetical protein
MYVRPIEGLCAAEITGGASYALPRLREWRDRNANEANQIKENIRLMEERIRLLEKESKYWEDSVRADGGAGGYPDFGPSTPAVGARMTHEELLATKESLAVEKDRRCRFYERSCR